MRRVILITVLLCLPPSAGMARDHSFRLSSGEVIETPAVDGMDCGALSEKLSEIDGTEYRGTRPAPRDPEDEPLLRYEEEVAAAFYRSCVMRALGERNPSAAFTKGYRGED